MEKEVEAELWEANSVADMLNVLINRYRLNEAKPGIMTKALLISGLKSAINMVKPKKR